MFFTLYLEAVKHCNKAGIPVKRIKRHGDYWQRYWTVPTTKKTTKVPPKVKFYTTKGRSCHA